MPRKYGNKRKSEHAGEVRQSQLVSTFGVGSIVDFVRDTVIIAGVDNWDNSDDWEEQKLFNNNLQAVTGVNYFLAPKTATNVGSFRKSTDVESYIFPRYLYCPICNHIVDVNELNNQQRKHMCFMPNESKNKPCGSTLVPSRFVLVCPKGHIEDFPFSWWVHQGVECEKTKNPRIKMYNIDNRSDIDSLRLECTDCGARRGVSIAFSKNAFSGKNGYKCRGKHTHLGVDYTSECDEVMTARLRSSSSVYFPAALSALTIPPWSRRAVQWVEREYEELIDREQYGEKAISDYIERKAKKQPLRNLTTADYLMAFKIVKEQKGSSKMQTEADIFAAEYDVLCRGETSEDDYVASTAKIPYDFEDIFESITIVDKLTVINALVGFTRIEPWGGDLNSDRLAHLSRSNKEWLPAIKLLGEGIFFKFKQEVLYKWVKTVGNKYSDMENELGLSFLENDRFSAQYVALHTFSHLLIRQLANDCGYSASSISEKIYSTYQGDTNNAIMGGVLVYLSTSDSEGSLGGLISIAKDHKRMGLVLKNMLYKALWCSADPLCSTSRQQGFHSLNYAACHDCVLLPETSCEFRNVLLDRVSVVGSSDDPKIGLMGEIAASLLRREVE